MVTAVALVAVAWKAEEIGEIKSDAKEKLEREKKKKRKKEEIKEKKRRMRRR